ncbi:NAD-dependent epimerase/dehydratase family protein [Ferruginibacter paludis]|uniref:NAD-dependent epimerase/dehydratase family protein n=1 Tax=Ferruginibacter paludis TaxID=1310417 RepID=UPI0025B3F3AE|nr:NAD-dependent epimerase/dehydratase family protein [Ferruginibacter paludis]MDN3658391.1 NAD-dependent epimerase/dehydratase family protein [Ferruginibacter paludis]
MILVTGGSGLLGKEVITQLLAQGKGVTAIYNKTALPSFDSTLLTQVRCNILDVIGLEELMQQDITQVYHCAAIVTFNPRRKKELFTVNIEGTANIVNAALNAGVNKMVYVSSVAALGRKFAGEMINETMPWTEENSTSSYGQSKYMAELEVWRGIAEGLDAVVVNPTIILGAGDWESGSSQIFKTAYDEFPWYTDGINGFVDVRDVASIMLQLMDSNITAERFIVSAANKTYQEIFNLIATAFHKKQPHKKVTPLIAKMVWRMEALKSLITGKDPLLTKETAASALSQERYDNSKLKSFLPQFNYRSIESTINETSRALQQKLNNR